MTTQESREQEIKRLNAEKVKQIALCHFYSYYVRHNMSDMLAYVGEDVTWLGSQSNFVAHNRQEFENLLEREIKKVPKQCVMKVISADVSQVSGNCYLRGWTCSDPVTPDCEIFRFLHDYDR